MLETLEYLRSLGFGGLFGAGLLGLLYFLVPDFLTVIVPLESVLLVGGLLGAGGHKIIESVLSSTLAILAQRKKRIGKREFWRKITDLENLKGILEETERQRQIKELSREYMLPWEYTISRESLNSSEIRQLPPGQIDQDEK